MRVAGAVGFNVREDMRTDNATGVLQLINSAGKRNGSFIATTFDVLLDSFARIELVLAMEEHFGIELSDSEAADLSTVDEVVRLIMSKQEGAAASD